VTVIVNGRRHTANASALSYDDVVRLARDGAPTSALFSVTYRKAGGGRESGILAPGESVTIADGTIFNAYVTGNA
jgi:hypothetical protein